MPYSSPYLSTDEINTHLYGEVVSEISRLDTTLLETAIAAAIAEAKGYLRVFDLDLVFGAIGDDRNPILLLYVKDCAVWHYLQLANPAVDMAIRLTRYEKAIDWFKMVQSGKTNPDLPYPEVAPPDEPSNYMKWGGIAKRNNNY